MRSVVRVASRSGGSGLRAAGKDCAGDGSGGHGETWVAGKRERRSHAAHAARCVAVAWTRGISCALLWCCRRSRIAADATGSRGACGRGR
jgi:hypothetical protein